MDLSAEQQERYSRHLLLDGWGGEGQERLLQARIRVRGAGVAALWCARYLAGSGVGAVVVEEPLAAEVRAANPDAHVVCAGPSDIEVAPRGAAVDGARAALRAIVGLLRAAR
jgi:hypothetical protein